MILVNDLEYNKFETKILWGNFFVNYSGKKRCGIAPFITFHFDDIVIGLEFTFSKEMFENTSVGIKTDIKEYISDITFEDKKGWISINDGQYDCSLTRINEKNFNIKFHILAYDNDDKYEIVIDENTVIL